jgi:selenocysteine-specific elongation factor
LNRLGISITDKLIATAVVGRPNHGKTCMIGCLTEMGPAQTIDNFAAGRSPSFRYPPFRLPSGVRVAFEEASSQPPGASEKTNPRVTVVDLGILVVAADEGIGPQTREHLDALKDLQVKGGFTVLQKTDLADDETIELAELEILEATDGSIL